MQQAAAARGEPAPNQTDPPPAFVTLEPVSPKKLEITPPEHATTTQAKTGDPVTVQPVKEEDNHAGQSLADLPKPGSPLDPSKKKDLPFVGVPDMEVHAPMKRQNPPPQPPKTAENLRQYSEPGKRNKLHTFAHNPQPIVSYVDLAVTLTPVSVPEFDTRHQDFGYREIRH